MEIKTMPSFGSIASNIRGVYHQVNPLDNGRTYKTNQHARQSAGSQGGGGGAWGPAKQPVAKNEAVSNAAASFSGSTANAQAQAQAQAQAAKQQQIDFVNRSFGAKLAGLQGQLNVLPSQQRAGELQLQNEYQTKQNKLDTSRSQGLRNLSQSERQVLDSRERGLKSLADQLRQQGMSYSNQLGTMGAGDSSASGMVNFALGGQASRNRGDLVRNASGQEVAIGNQRADLEVSYKQNVSDLTNWKQNQLNDLYEKFSNMKNQIANEMANASLQRQQQLAQYDAGVTQQAIAQLGNIENMYRQQSTQLQQHYQNMFAPKEIDIAPELQQYAVRPIDAGTLEGLQTPAPVNGDVTDTVLRKKLDEQQDPLAL
jgi:hypothetical protein